MTRKRRASHRHGGRILKFDVAENAKRFIFDDTPLVDNGGPAKRCPATLTNSLPKVTSTPTAPWLPAMGLWPMAAPSFQKKVLGRWTCRGWHVGEGALTKTGPWVITHQLYDFGKTPGHVTLTTDGLELVDVDVPIRRAIIGGTGPYALARGEAIQTMLGFNQLEGVNLRLVLKVKQ